MALLLSAALPSSACFQSTRPASKWRSSHKHGVSVICSAEKKTGTQQQSRRETLLAGVNVGVLGALFTFGAAPRPSSLGVKDYGGGVKTLSLCPPTPNCISTAEEANDMKHFVPPWTYNPEEGRGRKNPVTKEQAMNELVQVLEELHPDKFDPKIVTKTADYVYVEYQSPTFGFTDDVEFYFPDGKSEVEYRSASRVGESDFDINRKRIRDIRKALEPKGWKSVGF